MQNLYIIWDFVKEWYWIPLLLINTTAFMTILVENAKPEKTIAWLMVIVFLPFIGVILYYFFGQKFQKEKYFKKLDNRYKVKLDERWNDLKPFISKEIKLTETYDDHLNDVFEYLVCTQTSIPTSNNSAKLLINGEEKFALLLEDLKNATQHIHIEYYIFDEDEIGSQILAILVDKAKQGVEIRLIMDDIGSSPLAERTAHYK